MPNAQANNPRALNTEMTAPNHLIRQSAQMPHRLKLKGDTSQTIDRIIILQRHLFNCAQRFANFFSPR